MAITYYLPDITGTNPLYKKVNMPAFVKQIGYKIFFENSPAFLAGLTIKLTDGTGYTLVRNVDFEVRDDDINQLATSRALLQNPQFTGTLLTSVTIINARAVGKPLASSYQEFYMTNPGYVPDDGTPFEVTPELIKSLVSGLGDVRQQIAKVVSPVALNQVAPKLLPFDQNGELASNLVTGEPVTINTIAGIDVIRLAHGAFFADSLEIFYNGTKLDPTTDYVPIGLSPITMRSSNKSGIYENIGINGEFAGTLVINYRAVGGDVQAKDLDALYNMLLGITNYLNDSIFVTSGTIQETPAFRAMNARQLILEDQVKRLLNGTPTYADGSAGTATTRPIKADNADLHWYTIATLFKVDGSNDIVRADQFKGRVFLPDSKISLGFTAELNIDQDRNKVSIRTDSLIFDPTYRLFNDVSVNAPQYPMVRVVWNQAAQSFSGACLQIGIALPALQDRMVVENLSTPESCWILNRRNEAVTGQVSTPYTSPEDNAFLLPDGVTLWSSSGSSSNQYVYAPRYDDGYLAYSGSTVTLNTITTISSTAAQFNLSLPSYFPIQRAKYLCVTMLSADSNTMYEIELPLTGNTESQRVGRATFMDSAGETYGLSTVFNKDAMGVITISLNAVESSLPLISQTPSPKTDIVRYIRIKV